MNKSIPSGWEVTTFDEVFTQISTTGKKVKTSETKTDGRFPVVDQGRTFISGYLDDENLVVSDEKPLIIFGDHTREIKWIDFPFIPGADGVKILKPARGLNSRLLYFFLRNLPIESKGYARHFKLLKEAKYLTPPIAEQTRIAQKLDELLAQVDTLKTRINGIPALLKRFRQSALAAAVSGQLTEGWRTKHSDQNTQKRPNLPDWTQTVFGEICREITVGYVGKMVDQYRDNGVPFLRSQNVRPLRFSLDNILYISEDFHDSIFKSRLEPGDLAIVRSGAPGVTCVIPESLLIANCSDLVIARPSGRLNSWFGCIYMNSVIAQRNVADNQVGVAQQHFNVGSMKRMPINLPPIEEQAEIVRRVEQLFAFSDQVEAEVAAAKARIDKLTQSILAKAFRGELVPQDPNDEPASELLARIKAQRDATPQAKRGRNVSAS